MRNSNHGNRKAKSLLYLIIIGVLALIFTLYVYLPLNCATLGSTNARLATSTQLTPKQLSQLTQFISDDIHGEHPYLSYGFGIVASESNYACVRIVVGRDIRLQRTPDSDPGSGDYGEYWAMLYFGGRWWKLGASRFRG